MRIFQSRNNDLVEIHEEPFDLERTIQNLIEKNLDSIFSGLEFVETEFQIDDLRPDTIASVSYTHLTLPTTPYV